MTRVYLRSISTSDSWEIALRRKASGYSDGVAKAVMIHRLESSTAVSSRSGAGGARHHKWSTYVEVAQLSRAALSVGHLALHCYCNEQEKQRSFGAERNQQRFVGCHR